MLKGIALGLAASLALVSLAASAKIVNRIESVQSYYFADSMWVNKGPEGSVSLSPPLPPQLVRQCFVGCGPIFGPFVIRRVELLTSNAADVSPNKVRDATGHAQSVSGIIVTKRVDPMGVSADFGFETDRVVYGEHVLDANGTHSWSFLSPDILPDARWLPIEPFRFESAGPIMQLNGVEPSQIAVPEWPPWELMALGFATLAFAHAQSSRGRS
jgi:hypothetical protein